MAALSRLALVSLLVGCGADAGGKAAPERAAAADDADSGGAAADADTDADADADTDADADADTDADADADADADTDADTDADMVCPTLPAQELAPSSAQGTAHPSFLWRTHTGGNPSWVTDVAETSLGDADVQTMVRGPEIDGTTPFKAAVATAFDGTRYWRGDETLESGDTTIEAWFRTSHNTGYQTLFSNTEGGGFSLKIKDGQLRGSFRIEDGDGWENLEHIAFDVADGLWHHAAFTVDHRADGYALCLWLDGAADCVVDSDHSAPKASSVTGTVGAEPNRDGTYSFEHFFIGELFAVKVHPYLVDESWLADRVLRDGAGPYFGSPSYHDYADAWQSGPSVRTANAVSGYPSLIDATAARYRLPYLNDGYVVQGVGGNSLGEVVLGMYRNVRYDDPSCDTEPHRVPSLLVAFDPCDSVITATWLLRHADGSANPSHLGGIAHVSDTLVWTPIDGGDGGGLYLYDLTLGVVADPLTDRPPSEIWGGGDPMVLEPVARQNAPCGKSYLSHDPLTGLLWAGEFKNGSTGRICAFQVRSDGSFDETPVHSYDLPQDRIQGAEPLPDGRLLLTRSYSDTESDVYVWDPLTDALDRVMGAPPGLEDTWLSPDGLLWTASESGSRYYQKRDDENSSCSANWEGLYPYAWALDMAAMRY